jgi:hypothetical protein
VVRAGSNVYMLSAPSVLTLSDARGCAGMAWMELVAMIRATARRTDIRTSRYRGVFMLIQTGKWHAQINVGRKQVWPLPE